MVNTNRIAAYIGIAGLSLSAAGYIINSVGKPSPMVVGMGLLVIGYMFLLSAHVYELSNDEEEIKHHHIEPLIIIGYLFIFLFFFGIHIFPSMTGRVRYYDSFAAAGAFLRMIPMFVTSFAGALLLMIYYILGTIPKLFEKGGLVDHMQLISRPLLVLYYALVIIIMISSIYTEKQEEEEDHDS